MKKLYIISKNIYTGQEWVDVEEYDPDIVSRFELNTFETMGENIHTYVQYSIVDPTLDQIKSIEFQLKLYANELRGRKHAKDN